MNSIRLRHLVELAPRPSHRLAPDAEVSFVPMEAIADGVGGLDASTTRPLHEVASASYNHFADGDILLAKVTPCFENGKKALAQGLVNGVGYATSEVHVLRPRKGAIDPRFLIYLLSSAQFRHEGIASMTGAGGLRRISDAAILNHRPKVTDLATQKSIADFLDRETARIDGLIREKEVLIAVLNEREKAAIEAHVLFDGRPECDLPLSGPTSRGGIPDGWQRHRLRHMFRPVKRQGHVDETVLSVFRQFGVVEKDAYEGNHNKTPEDLSLYQLVRPRDLVINKMKAWQGSLGISPHRGITSPDYVVLVPEHGHDDRFLHFLLRCPRMAHAYSVISTGVRPAQWRLDVARFLDLSLWLPPLGRQEEIVQYLEHGFRLGRRVTEKTKASIDRLTELRSALITAAVTGRIDPAAWHRRGHADRALDRIEMEAAK